MFRHEIYWSSPPAEIRLRGHGHARPDSTAEAKDSAPAAAMFPNELGQQVSVTPHVSPPPVPDLRPLLEAIGSQLGRLDERREQSLAELQQVAIELAIAVASQLTFQSISREQFAVEELVKNAISTLGGQTPPVVCLHPQDLQLLQKRLAQEPASWEPHQVILSGDAGVNRGGCRVESGDGRMHVSDISLRLSEIRRHWMEELDDAQVERRDTQSEGPALRRFPDRREIA